MHEKLLARPLDWFTQWMATTGEHPPDFDAMRSMPDLPPLLKFADGRPVVNMDEWQERRREIKRLLCQWFFGRFPESPPELRGATILHEERERGAVRRQVELTYATTPAVSFTVETMTPQGPGPFPVFLTQTTHRAWAVLGLSRGYLCCVYPAADGDDQSDRFLGAYPECDWARIPRRAWLASRALDYLLTLDEVDRDRIAITGHSRNGKQSMIAAAMDPRITAVVSSSSGSAGATPYRFVSEAAFEESVEFTTRLCPDWFHPRLRFFTGREDRLPIDIHGLLGLIAPRHCLLSTAQNDGCETTFAVERSYLAGKQVYEFLGRPDALRIRWRAGSHETKAEDVQAYFDWFDHAFGLGEHRFPERLMHAFDWQAWARGRECAPPGPGAGARQRVEWGLGEPPPVGIEWGGKYGAEKAHNAGLMKRTLAPVGGVRQLGVQFSDYHAGDLYLPEDARAGRPAPVVIWLHPYSYSTGYTGAYMDGERPYLALAQRGFAVFAYDQLGFGQRLEEGSRFYSRYPRWSKLGKMVRDLHGVLDLLHEGADRFRFVVEARFGVELPELDLDHVFCLGYSLGGMVGLYGAALDERISGVASFCGFTPMRTDTDGKATGGLRRLWEWHGLQPRLGFYRGRERELPYDFEDVLSLIAPRPCLIVSPTHDREADFNDVAACVACARRAWERHGAADRRGGPAHPPRAAGLRPLPERPARGVPGLDAPTSAVTAGGSPLLRAVRDRADAPDTAGATCARLRPGPSAAAGCVLTRRRPRAR